MRKLFYVFLILINSACGQVTTNRGVSANIGINYWFFGDSFTAANYAPLDMSNRYSHLICDSLHKIEHNLAVGGQALSFGCSNGNVFDTSLIPVKTPQDGKAFLCWSLDNDIGTTVTGGVNNTASYCGNSLKTIINIFHRKGWNYIDIVLNNDYYAISYPPSNLHFQDTVYKWSDTLQAVASRLGCTTISNRAYMLANGGCSLLMSCVPTYNIHPNLPAQQIIKQNVINHLAINPLLVFLFIGIALQRTRQLLISPPLKKCP